MVAVVDAKARDAGDLYPTSERAMASAPAGEADDTALTGAVEAKRTPAPPPAPAREEVAAAATAKPEVLAPTTAARSPAPRPAPAYDPVEVPSAPRAPRGSGRTGPINPWEMGGLGLVADERYRGTPTASHGPVKLVSYFPSGEEGVIAFVQVKLDKHLTWMQYQTMVNILGQDATDLGKDYLLPEGVAPLPDSAAVLSVPQQTLVRFLSSVVGPTPLQLLMRPAGQNPKPVMLSEVLPTMAADVTVAIIPAQ